MSGYGQYCPVAKAAEVLGEKWSIIILRELAISDQTFNSLRRGMPLISPTLLSKRLKTLMAHEVVERMETAGGVQYRLTQAGLELKDLIMQLGVWGQRWVRSDYSKPDLDASLLMWDMHRTINTEPFPASQRVIQFEFLGVPAKDRFYWLVVANREVEVCMKNPGFDVDLHIQCALKEFTAFWMGETTLTALERAQKIRVEGDSQLRKSMGKWLCGSAFSGVERGHLVAQA
ncbi:MAG TPA: helix-turn-helix domain-containing protein [Dongiaceae bacterium]|nr:helix-turn-helix domain-containing protein [Dongiaceae bacterium]